MSGALYTPRHRGLLLAGLIIAMLFAALDGTIVGTAMPRIVGELGGLGLMAWLTTAYMLTSTTVVPIAGKLADLLGRRVVYMTGLIIFMVSSALCGIASSMEQLILFRALQGIGGGVMMPMSMIIIGDLFTGRERAKWQGMFGAIYGLASVLGPQVGGWIVDNLSWEWVFYINLPVGLLAVIFIGLGLPKHKVEGKVKFDYMGIFTMIVGVVSFLLVLSFGGDKYEWLSWQIITLSIVAIAFLVAFVQVERKAEEPILPMHLFKNRTFTMLNGVGFFMSIGMFGAIMFVPLFMQGIVGISATDSGTIMTPMMISMIITSIIGGQLVYKIGMKLQLIIGMSALSAGTYLLTTLDMDTTKLTATSYMAIIGLGIGLVMPIITVALQESFPRTEMGVVTSSSQFFRSIGGTFGMTILGSVMNHTSTSQLTDRLEPALKNLPAEAKPLVDQFDGIINENPQGIYNILFNPDMLNKIPEPLRDLIVPSIKTSLVHSLHSVFLVGVGFVAVGFLLALVVKSIKLTGRPKQEEQQLDAAANQ